MDRLAGCAIGMVVVCAELVGCVDEDPTCHTPCTGNDVCVRGVCANAFDQDWSFTVTGISITALEPDGTVWDAFDGSPPDPYAMIFIDNVAVLQTDHSSDAYIAHWTNKSPRTRLSETSTFEAKAFDADPLGPGDLILDCQVGALTADLLRMSGFVCTGAGGRLTIGYTPLPR